MASIESAPDSGFFTDSSVMMVWKEATKKVTKSDTITIFTFEEGLNEGTWVEFMMDNNVSSCKS